MCVNACPCSRPMTRAAVVKKNDTDLNVLLVKVQQIGERFIDLPYLSTLRPGDVCRVQANADGTWRLAD